MKKQTLFFAFLLLNTAIFAQKRQMITVSVKKNEHRVDILADGKPFTSFIFPSDTVIKKHTLYPIFTANGTEITRGYPMSPRAGERVDHPHHVGQWLNYESVNGFDFWNNSNAIKDRSKYGTIKNTQILQDKSAKEGILVVASDWIVADGKGKTVLKETTTFKFTAKGKNRIIDRTTTLTALSDTVLFKDVKDGLFAIRVARELEHPSDKADEFVDANGIITKVEKLDNSTITGKYRSSEGIEGEAVWSTRAKWMNLSGKIKNEEISVCLIDHPQNINYPTYWHARGYGLFSANPLGQSIFKKGQAPLNLTLAPSKSVTFRFRTVISSSKLTDKAMNEFADGFAKSK
jgi:Methane oxygenase PmoA